MRGGGGGGKGGREEEAVSNLLHGDCSDIRVSFPSLGSWLTNHNHTPLLIRLLLLSNIPASTESDPRCDGLAHYLYHLVDVIIIMEYDVNVHLLFGVCSIVY